MKRIPYIEGTGKNACLMVDGKPFRSLGGEIYNSNASSLKYMEEKVWPSVRLLGGNSILVPVYWECVEQEKGVYNFDLVDGIIAQARREHFRLGLLWFGLWKNGSSTYVPEWMKLDERYFFIRTGEGHLLQCVSPLCREAVEEDAKAFAALMRHLREVDGEENTVILVQVENEMGALGASRDWSEKANAEFVKPVPQAVSDIFGKTGTWQEVFGADADEYFMCYHYAAAIEYMAAKGKKEYPLPLYVNAWLNQFPEEAGKYPSGGPMAERFDIWHPLTPSIDFYAPDIYVSNYRDICDLYAKEDNPLFIPEVRSSMDALPFLYYAVGKYNAMGFHPFGCEGIFAKIVTQLDAGLLQELNISKEALTTGAEAGMALKEGYRRIFSMDELIRKAHAENRIFAFLQQNDLGKVFEIDQWIVTVAYAGTVSRRAVAMPKKEGEPVGGGFIIYLGNGEFICCGVSCTVIVTSRLSSGKTAFIIRKEEGEFENGQWIPGRILNGDEQLFLHLTRETPIQRIRYYERKK